MLPQFKRIVHPKMYSVINYASSCCFKPVSQIKIFPMKSYENVSNDYFIDVLTTFLGLECFSYVAVYGESESSRISSKLS